MLAPPDVFLRLVVEGSFEMIPFNKDIWAPKSACFLSSGPKMEIILVLRLKLLKRALVIGQGTIKHLDSAYILLCMFLLRVIILRMFLHRMHLASLAYVSHAPCLACSFFACFCLRCSCWSIVLLSCS